jgi:DNA-binding response OmpR family regulator
MADRILVVEDDESLCAALVAHLARYGYDARGATGLERVEAEFQAFAPHLVVLDVNLPFQDGFHVARRLRALSAAPILFLSARGGDLDQVLAVESGGDDYMTKPFNIEVLLARVRALLRRAYGEYARLERDPAVLRAGSLELDLGAGTLAFGSRRVSLARNEVRLAQVLVRRAGRTVPREDCLEALWDERDFVDDNTLSVNVARLRARLEALGATDAIQTRRGVGYRLALERLGGG